MLSCINKIITLWDLPVKCLTNSVSHTRDLTIVVSVPVVSEMYFLSLTVLLYCVPVLIGYDWSLTTRMDNNQSGSGLAEFSVFIYKSKQAVLP